MIVNDEGLLIILQNKHFLSELIFILSTKNSRQIALKALSERLSKDHAKPWQQERTKKHSPAPSIVVPIPESVITKSLPTPLTPQINIDIHSHSSTSDT